MKDDLKDVNMSDDLILQGIVPDRRCSIKKISDQASACTQRLRLLWHREANLYCIRESMGNMQQPEPGQRMKVLKEEHSWQVGL